MPWGYKIFYARCYRAEDVLITALAKDHHSESMRLPTKKCIFISRFPYFHQACNIPLLGM